MKNDVIKYYNLLEQIQGLVQKSKAQVQRNVNTIIVQTYWQIGYYIVEYEQKGSERAEYGTALLRNLSQDLTEQFGRGYSYRNLQLAKKFYNTFPIVQSLVAQSSEKKLTPIEKALLNCSWTHLVRLLSIKDETERHFYLIETVANNWSVRDLNRQIDSALFERLLLNKNISTVKQIATQEEVTAMDNVLIEYSLPKENQQIYSKEYLLYLPQKEELKKMLESINIK